MAGGDYPQVSAAGYPRVNTSTNLPAVGQCAVYIKANNCNGGPQIWVKRSGVPCGSGVGNEANDDDNCSFAWDDGLGDTFCYTINDAWAPSVPFGVFPSGNVILDSVGNDYESCSDCLGVHPPEDQCCGCLDAYAGAVISDQLILGEPNDPQGSLVDPGGTLFDPSFTLTCDRGTLTRNLASNGGLSYDDAAFVPPAVDCLCNWAGIEEATINGYACKRWISGNAVAADFGYIFAAHVTESGYVWGSVNAEDPHPLCPDGSYHEQIGGTHINIILG